jgi:hypothetical protein
MHTLQGDLWMPLTQATLLPSVTKIGSALLTNISSPSIGSYQVTLAFCSRNSDSVQWKLAHLQDSRTTTLAHQDCSNVIQSFRCVYEERREGTRCYSNTLVHNPMPICSLCSIAQHRLISPPPLLPVELPVASLGWTQDLVACPRHPLDSVPEYRDRTAPGFGNGARGSRRPIEILSRAVCACALLLRFSLIPTIAVISPSYTKQPGAHRKYVRHIVPGASKFSRS